MKVRNGSVADIRDTSRDFSIWQHAKLARPSATGHKQTFTTEEGAVRKTLVIVDMSEITTIDHLQQVLYETLEFPGWYGMNWNAFWDAITGLVDMPEQLQFIGWDLFAKRFPSDARIMKDCLDDMSNKMPALAGRVIYA